MIFGLNQATRIVPSRYMMESNVVWQGAEERDSLANEHWNARDDQAVNPTATTSL